MEFSFILFNFVVMEKNNELVMYVGMEGYLQFYAAVLDGIGIPYDEVSKRVKGYRESLLDEMKQNGQNRFTAKIDGLNTEIRMWYEEPNENTLG